MALSNHQLHVFAAIGTVVLLAAVAGPTLVLAGSAPIATGPALEDMTAIEASIAYKKPQPPKQPQKKASQPDVAKPDGVSRDENKVTDPKPDPDKPPKKADDKDLSQKFKHADDDDSTGKATPDVGDFNGQEYGFAEETKGDAYFQGVAKDIHESWEFPTILNSAGVPVGCLHIGADGKIADTLLRTKSGDESLDDSVERALKKVKKLRDDNPVPVPTYLLKAATTKWVCFKFNLTSP